MPYLTSILTWLSYHPADFSFLAWISYVPMILYIFKSGISPGGTDVGQSGKIALFKNIPLLNRMGFKLHVYLSAYLFFFLGASWMRHVTWAGLFIAPGILSFYWLGFAWLARLLIRRGIIMFNILLIPSLWAGIEFVRSFFLTGFPWFFAGHTQYSWLGLIQISDITGVYGVSFLVMMVNTSIALIIYRKITKTLDQSGVITALLCPAVIILAALIYGYIRIDRINITPGPRIGIVQGNIEQSLKNNPPNPLIIYEKHLKLSMQLISGETKPDLIVWAETMFPYACSNTIKKSEVTENMDILKEPSIMSGVPHLIGAVTFEPDETGADFKMYNSAYYLDKEGKTIGQYSKIHLVPISEYVPLRKTFPWLDNLILTFSELSEIRDMQAGTNAEPFSLGNLKFGVLICYESIFPELARASVRRGSNFIINISNDGWFKNSAELNQILAISAFRAVESRRSFIRATNTGISAVIHPNGKINILKNNTDAYKEVEGAWAEQIPVATTSSFYANNGDYFAFLCLIISLTAVFASLRKISKNS
ncbi:MAG: apolipoprotein N-acyltransferase [Candidatus Brocadiia bacterium]